MVRHAATKFTESVSTDVVIGTCHDEMAKRMWVASHRVKAGAVIDFSNAELSSVEAEAKVLMAQCRTKFQLASVLMELFKYQMELLGLRGDDSASGKMIFRQDWLCV